MQLLLYKLLVQAHSISLRYNQSLGEEAAVNCDKMTGIVLAGFPQIRNSRILKTTLFSEINNKLKSFQ
jgi:hypothetical protein